MKHLILAFGCALTLSACTGMSSPELTSKAPLVHYTCENDAMLTARYEAGSAIVTRPDGQTIRLPRQPAGNDVWYSSGQYDLRLDGDNALWSVGRSAATLCTVESK